MFNLFDVTTGCNTLGTKARSATMEERNAYLRWLAERDGVHIPINATFGDEGIRAAGELILAMPGYGDTRRPMLEVLDDDGNVIRATPIALDARGRMTMTKAQVQEATGLKPIRARKAAARPVEHAPEPTPIRVAQNAPIEPQGQPEPASDGSEEMAALASEFPFLAFELRGGKLFALEDGVTAFTCMLAGGWMKALRNARENASMMVEERARRVQRSEAIAEPVAIPDPAEDYAKAMTARLEALERQVATLSRQVTPIGERAPRSAAHERAVRRAWAERKARRQIANDLAIARQDVASVYRDAERFAARGNVLREKRRRTVINARATLSRSRQAAADQRQRADVLQVQLTALRAAMADPSQPERASDINRLMTERDQARTACAALEQRCANMQSALERTADTIEDLASRATRAEAQLRARAA